MDAQFSGQKRSMFNSQTLSMYSLPTQFGSKRTFQQRKFSNRTNPCFSNHLDKYFKKQYFFKSDPETKKLPSSSKLFCHDKWKVDTLMELKKELNSVKSELNDYNLEEWHRHTKFTNKAAEVQKYIRNYVKPELLTQAWCKFYEAVSSCDLVPKEANDKGYLNSVHLCEAPGAFVTALNHYLSLNFQYTEWKWLASTLSPYHEQNSTSEMINDDRLIFNTLENWNFGRDGTGNLQDPENMKNLVQQAANEFPGGVSLVTADGSFDCQLQPAEQESLVSSLFYCEAITALTILKPGGSFMLKLFTLFECETICLLYLLYCSFGTLRLLKPVTSKEGNSEVYLICLKYNPTDELRAILKILTAQYGPDITKKAMFGKDDIPDQFMVQAKRAAELFKKQQEEAIRSNINKFNNRMSVDEINQLQTLQQEIAQEYIKRYKLESQGNQIVGFLQLKNTPALNIELRLQEGTFNEKQERSHASKKDHLQNLKNTAKHFKCSWPSNIHSFRFPENVPKLSLKFGKPVDVVNSSKFCVSRLLRIYNEVNKVLGPSQIISEKLQGYEFSLMVCDVSNESWCTETWLAQKKTTLLLFEKLSDMETDHSLLLFGLPLLTQYNVGLVYILGHLFSEVYFNNPQVSGYSIFFKYLDKERLRKLPIQYLVTNVQKSNKNDALLSLLPIVDICRNLDFYTYAVAANHLCLKHYIQQRIVQYQENTTSG